MSSVIVTDAWPRRSLTTFTGTPAFSRIEAWVCLRSCSRMRSRVERATSRSKDWEKASGFDLGAVGTGEDQVVVLVGVGADEYPFFELALPPSSQHGDGALVEIDGAPAGVGLHVGDREFVGDEDDAWRTAS